MSKIDITGVKTNFTVRKFEGMVFSNNKVCVFNCEGKQDLFAVIEY